MSAVLTAAILACVIYYQCKRSKKHTDINVPRSTEGGNPSRLLENHDESSEHVNTHEPSTTRAERENTSGSLPAVQNNEESEHHHEIQRNFVLAINDATRSLESHKDNEQERIEMASLESHM